MEEKGLFHLIRAFESLLLSGMVKFGGDDNGRVGRADTRGGVGADNGGGGSKSRWYRSKSSRGGANSSSNNGRSGWNGGTRLCSRSRRRSTDRNRGERWCRT